MEGANQLNSTNASKIVRNAMDKYSQAVIGIRSVLKFYFLSGWAFQPTFLTFLTMASARI